MAKLYVAECKKLVNAQHLYLPAPLVPWEAEQVVTFTTTTPSDAFGSNTGFVRLIADADCHIEFGLAPTATTANALLKANTVEYFAVHPGHKVAALAA